MSERTQSRLMALIDELARAAESAGLEVRRERLLREVGYRARGGACRLREKNLVIIDTNQAPNEQLDVLVSVLRDFDLESLYLSPDARRLLEAEVEKT